LNTDKNKNQFLSVFLPCFIRGRFSSSTLNDADPLSCLWPAVVWALAAQPVLAALLEAWLRASVTAEASALAGPV